LEQIPEINGLGYSKRDLLRVFKCQKLKDFMGDIIDTRVASVDYLDGRYLLLSDSGLVVMQI